MAENENPAPVQNLINPNLRLPPELNITSGNVSENFKTWKRQVEVYLLASGTSNLPEIVQTATIINCGGESLLKVYDQFTWSENEDKNNPQHVLLKFENYCNPRRSEVAESFKFWSTKYNAQEPIDNFITELRTRAASCNFGALEDRLIRDKIVFSTSGKMQQLLLREDNLDLPKAIRISQSYEHANKQAQAMRDDSEKIHRLAKHGKGSKQGYKQTGEKEHSHEKHDKRQNREFSHKENKSCKFCGYKHPMKKESCPAW